MRAKCIILELSFELRIFNYAVYTQENCDSLNYVVYKQETEYGILAFQSGSLECLTNQIMHGAHISCASVHHAARSI